MTEDILDPIVESARLFLETPFSEYTVVEGFLLLLFLALFVRFLIWLFKEGF